MKEAPGVSGESEPCFARRHSAALARATLYIANAADQDLAAQAIAEIIRDFASGHGSEELMVFRRSLSERLERRGDHAAAMAVLQS
ncbi:hypothetical protein [Paraburkholderia sp. SIMBA_054]|uniref:hypothetical protein n=1 Tax=Paraburkholderia sp. SIMBA_054 TaxID=3085795 RepID=UPI00397D3064